MHIFQTRCVDMDKMYKAILIEIISIMSCYVVTMVNLGHSYHINCAPQAIEHRTCFFSKMIALFSWMLLLLIKKKTQNKTEKH